MTESLVRSQDNAFHSFNFFIIYFVSPYLSCFSAFFYQLLAPRVLSSIPHDASIFFIFQLFGGVLFLNVFFFVLNYFIFTVVGIVHFRVVKFSTFWAWYNFLKHPFPLRKFFAPSNFLYNFMASKIFYSTKILLLFFWLQNFLRHLTILITFPS